MALLAAAQPPAPAHGGVPLFDSVRTEPFAIRLEPLAGDQATYVITLDSGETVRGILDRERVRSLQEDYAQGRAVPLSFETDRPLGRERRSERTAAVERETPRARREAWEKAARSEGLRLVDWPDGAAVAIPSDERLRITMAMQRAQEVEALAAWPSALRLDAVEEAAASGPSADAGIALTRVFQALIALTAFTLAGWVGLKFLP